MEKNRRDVPLLHRDDIDFRVVEEMNKCLEEQSPGLKVNFAGDLPGCLPPGFQEAIEQFNARVADLFYYGKCVDCECEIPGVARKADGSLSAEGFDLPEGWDCYYDRNNTPVAFQCPACQKECGAEHRLIGIANGPDGVEFFAVDCNEGDQEEGKDE